MSSDPQFSVEAFDRIVNLDPSFLLEIGFFAGGEESSLMSDDTVLASLIRLTAAAEMARLSYAGHGRTAAATTSLLRQARGVALQIAKYLDAETAAAMEAEEAQPRSAFRADPQDLDPMFAPLVACALGKPVEEANARELTLAIFSLSEAAEMTRKLLRAQGRDLAALADLAGAPASQSEESK